MFVTECSRDCMSTRTLTWAVGDTHSSSLILANQPFSLLQRIRTGQSLYHKENNVLPADRIPRAYTIAIDQNVDSGRAMSFELIPWNVQPKKVSDVFLVIGIIT